MLKFSIFLLFSQIPQSSPSIPYSDALSRRKLIFAAISSYSTEPGACLAHGFPDAIVRRQVTVACDDVAAGDTCSGYVTASGAEKAILVVFRGAMSNLHSIVENGETVFENQTSWPPGGLVSTFFYNGFFQIWNNGMNDDFNTMRAKYPGYQVWVLGHSIGGALASLAASHLSHFELVPQDALLLVTFGQPRTGNTIFADSLNTAVPNAYRITHSHDPVPHVPAGHDYSHFRSEVWYNENNGGWEICAENEGEKCSAQVKKSQFQFSDHLNYFNRDILAMGSSNCQNYTN